LISETGPFWVYVLENQRGRFYVGKTDDLNRRVVEHNEVSATTKGKYTPKNGPWNLVWSEPHPTRASAMQRERRIKNRKSARWIRQNLLNR
jgi:putative endonuclease